MTFHHFMAKAIFYLHNKIVEKKNYIFQAPMIMHCTVAFQFESHTPVTSSTHLFREAWDTEPADCVWYAGCYFYRADIWTGLRIHSVTPGLPEINCSPDQGWKL